jgi:hypothetical protein
VKRIFLILFVWTLTACTPLAPMAASPDSTSSPSVLVISTSIPRDKLTPAPTWMYLLPAAPTLTPEVVQQLVMPQPTSTVSTCLELVAPVDGFAVPKRKPVRFRWHGIREAQYYAVLLVHQSGLQEKIAATGTELTLAREANINDVSYRWSVLAYDSNNKLICGSPTQAFSLYIRPSAAAPATGGQVSSP